MIQQLRAHPDDLQLWQVYADQLQEAGDPLGELVALSLAHEASPSDATMLAIRACLGALFPRLASVSERSLMWVDGFRICSVGLRRGLADDVHLRWSRRDAGARAASEAMVDRVDHPGFLAMGRLFSVHGFDDLRDVVAPWLGSLQAFRAVDLRGQRWSTLPALEEVFAACPRLERLLLEGVPDGSRPSVRHPTLRELVWTPWPGIEELPVAPLLVSVETISPRDDVDVVLYELEHADLPALERLEVVGLDERSVADLRAVFGDRLHDRQTWRL